MLLTILRYIDKYYSIPSISVASQPQSTNVISIASQPQRTNVISVAQPIIAEIEMKKVPAESAKKAIFIKDFECIQPFSNWCYSEIIAFKSKSENSVFSEVQIIEAGASFLGENGVMRILVSINANDKNLIKLLKSKLFEEQGHFNYRDLKEGRFYVQDINNRKKLFQILMERIVFPSDKLAKITTLIEREK